MNTDTSTTDNAPADEQLDQQDAYTKRLADVNKTNDVISTEDIVNEKGILLAKKGTRVDKRLSNKLLQHRLVKPLEDTVNVKDGLDENSCNERLITMLGKHPDLLQIHSKLGFEELCEKLIKSRSLHPILKQKLTVYSLQMEEHFEKSLFVAWLSALIAREMGLGNDAIYSALIAGLFHDIGFLHIKKDVLQAKDSLTVQEWAAIQSHVVIGQMITKDIPGLPTTISEAILEHHERCDGTGYPGGKRKRSLGVIGQVVGMADSIEAIRMNQFAKTGRSIRDLMPYLHLNYNTYGYDVYQAVISILHQSGLSATHENNFKADKQYIAKLLQRAMDIMYGGHLLQCIAEDIMNHNLRRYGKSMLTVSCRVLEVLNRSGVVREDLINWLENLDADVDMDCLIELNDIELMQNELIWQLSNARKVFELFLLNEYKGKGEEAGRLLNYRQAFVLCVDALGSAESAAA